MCLFRDCWAKLGSQGQQVAPLGADRDIGIWRKLQEGEEGCWGAPHETHGAEAGGVRICHLSLAHLC